MDILDCGIRPVSVGERGMMGRRKVKEIQCLGGYSGHRDR